MCIRLEGEASCCKCVPYRDGILIAAQVIACTAFLLSLTGIAGIFFLSVAVLAVISFSSTCCCSMNRYGLVTTGIIGIVTTLSLVLFAVLVPSNLETNESEFRDRYGDGPYDEIMQQVKVRIGLAIMAAALWTIASILVFVFACSSRYERTIHPYEPVMATVV